MLLVLASITNLNPLSISLHQSAGLLKRKSWTAWSYMLSMSVIMVRKEMKLWKNSAFQKPSFVIIKCVRCTQRNLFFWYERDTFLEVLKLAPYTNQLKITILVQIGKFLDCKELWNVQSLGCLRGDYQILLICNENSAHLSLPIWQYRSGWLSSWE